MEDSKRNAGIAVLEAASSAGIMSKRRKIEDFSNVNIEDDGSGELGIGSLDVNSPAKCWNDGDTCSASFCLDRSPASCCSSNESSDVVKDGLRLVDPKAKRFEFEFETVDSTSINNIHKNFRETTTSSELSMDSEDTAASDRRRRRSPAAAGKAPPEDEIEEFFAAAEKSEQKRFAEKYNYDIVNDVPLEGRYHWVCLKP